MHLLHIPTDGLKVILPLASCLGTRGRVVSTLVEDGTALLSQLHVAVPATGLKLFSLPSCTQKFNPHTLHSLALQPVRPGITQLVATVVTYRPPYSSLP